MSDSQSSSKPRSDPVVLGTNAGTLRFGDGKRHDETAPSGSHSVVRYVMKEASIQESRHEIEDSPTDIDMIRQRAGSNLVLSTSEAHVEELSLEDRKESSI